MILSKALAAALAAALAWGAVGEWRIVRMKAAQDHERAALAMDAARSMERSMERRAAADLALAGVQAAVEAALRSKPSAPPSPIPCPASGDARDAVLPGLGDRLRAIDAAGGGPAAASVAPVPGAGSSDTGR